MTVVKICGITNLDDALCAMDAGADLLGFVFYSKSPRAVTLDLARAIIADIQARAPQASRARYVGVFVNESPARISQVMEVAGLDYAQLSGDESPTDLAAIGRRAYKAVRGWDASSAAFIPTGATDGFLPDLLLDAHHPTHYGGTGQRADASLALSLAQRYRLLLAGGLTPDNVAEVIRTVRPWGVDVASGVEASPGKKDHAKVRAFVAAAKAACRR
ncbi:MAG: N-(5'-phosphoribosyl)anthranilate isomerase [Candidatus Roseilinea sp.]|nr:MAG: N-(5'-phosphoribosyl)anthranilate isomerase [Candidatus Roseilinea sp.]